MRVLSSQVNIYFFFLFSNYWTTWNNISLRPHDVIFSNQGLTIPSSPLQTFASEDHYVRWKETETSHIRANSSRQEKYTVLSADKVEE